MLSWEAKTQIQQLWDLISLGDDVCTAATKAKSFKKEVSNLVSLVYRQSQMLKTLLCFVASPHTSLYLRPLHCIVKEVKVGFEHALSIVHKCKRGNLSWKHFTTCSYATQFVELFNCLNASISDMKWLLSIYMPQSCSTPTYEKPVKVKVWSCIAAVKMGRPLEDRVRAVKQLASLAEQNDEYKNIIYEEDGVPSLQKLLKEKISLDAQIMAVKTLCLLANEEERKRVIMKEMVSTILSRLSRTSAMSDQIQAANLVTGIAEHNPELKEYALIRENVIWQLVTLLSPAGDTKPNPKLKLSCSRALWMLVQGSISNCKTLTETKGMLCLAKLLKTEKDELHYNCLMIIREITAIAESNNEFRHSTFKSSSPSAKAVGDELLTVIKEFDNMKLRIPAIKSVGSLARSFPAKECQVISPLVARLGDMDREVAMEASIALQKFICPNNYLSCKHLKPIIESNGVPLLIKLLLDDGDEKLQCHRLTLICYLANHDSNSNVLIKEGALTALQTTALTVMAQDPELKQLVSQAICKLQSNKADKHQELENSRGIKQFITEQGKAVVDLVRGLKLKLETECVEVKMGRALEDRVRAVKQLASLAEQNDEYKNIIYEEDGVPSLQKLLKEKISLDAQIMAVKTLCLLANEEERKRVIMKEMVSTILSRLSRTSAMSDQIQAANLVTGIAEHNPELKEYALIRENVIWQLVTLLSPAGDTKPNLKLKLSCSRALWMLVQGSISNCKTLTETKGMLCLAKLLKTEKDELQYNCLMIVREITAIAESNSEFRHSAFKSSSPAAKAVVDELLRVIKEFDNMKLRIQAIKSLGSLARSFSAKECQVISPLVARLGDMDREVAMEASIALQKFICPNNHLSCEHSKSIIESNGVPLLIKLLLDDGDEKLQCHRLTLICYLANHDSNSNVLKKEGALTALQTTAPTVMAQDPELKQLVSQAICKLQSNKADKHQELENSRGIKRFITEQGKAVVDRDLNCGRGRVFGRIVFIKVVDITDAIAVIAGIAVVN